MTDTPNPVSGWSDRADTLITELHDLISSVDDDERAELLVAADRLKYQSADAYKQLVVLVTDRMGEQPEITTGNGYTIEKKTGSPRKKWDHESLGREVAQRIVRMSIDMDTGEMMKNTEEMLVEMLDYAAPSYWRVKNLSEIGIVADEYCEVGEANTSVIIRRDEA